MIQVFVDRISSPTYMQNLRRYNQPSVTQLAAIRDVLAKARALKLEPNGRAIVQKLRALEAELPAMESGGNGAVAVEENRDN